MPLIESDGLILEVLGVADGRLQLKLGSAYWNYLYEWVSTDLSEPEPVEVEEFVEVTLAQLEEELGYKIKIVSE